MTSYVDSHGRPVRVGAKLGSGGEGAVFAIVGDDSLVAKIYHRALPPERSRKIETMARLASPRLRTCAAWPVSALRRSSDRAVVGVVMPKIKNHVEIHDVYSPASRQAKFPKVDWEFLVHVARNCAAAIGVLHEHRCVIGDVNQGNVLVLSQGKVCVIDCDSFQIHDSGQIFGCDVGVPHYTPPELQGKSFRGILRTHNHDNFGLAVLVFHLLFMGRHPFAGRYLGSGDMPIELAIRDFRYAFGRNAATLMMERPKSTLPIEMVAPEVAKLFERAFCRGSELPNARPSAQEWHSALGKMLGGLRACFTDQGHKFCLSVPECPWCEIEEGGGPNFFVSVTLGCMVGDTFEVKTNIDELWKHIEAVTWPSVTNPSGTNVMTNAVGSPPPQEVESSAFLIKLLGCVFGGSALLLIGSVFIPMVRFIAILGLAVFGIWWAAMIILSPYHQEVRSRKNRVRRSKQQIDEERRRIDGLVSTSHESFKTAYQELWAIKRGLAGMSAAFRSELSALEATSEHRQRYCYLQSQLIGSQKIRGIGPVRAATLALYGIETAADIDADRIMGIPGFGADMTASLVSWRMMVEQRFRFNPANGVPRTERVALVMKFSRQQARAEATLRSGPAQLKRVSETLAGALRERQKILEQAEQSHAQAVADLRVMQRQASSSLG